MGFESIFLQGLVQKKKQRRQASQELEFMWKPTFEGIYGPQKSS
jgi:hypothetical protein